MSKGRSQSTRGQAVRRFALVSALAGFAFEATAQQDLSAVEITPTELGSGLAMLQGAGGNIGVSTGADGVLLIDDQFAPLTEKILAAVGKLSSEPIRFLLNTHWHADHTGGNENFGSQGVLIMAHQQVRERLRVDQFMAGGERKVPAAPKVAWPVVTFEDGLTLHLNGQTIVVTHVEPAHTDGDSIVHFVEADILHLGDTYFSGIYPFFDVASGGDIEGMIAAATRALEIAGPNTRIIPGHGPLSRPADLRSSRDMLVSIRDRVRKMVDRGLDRRLVVRARPSREFDTKFGGGFMSPDRFVGIVYDSLIAQ
jgi:glyoxylase-like metal-dependent hydrolase (beta-lactamase superfamily II)